MKKFLRAFACVSTLVLLSFIPAHGQTISGANQVQGSTPNGTAAQGNPVWIGGWNGTNVSGAKVDSNGNLVSSPATTTPADATSNTNVPGPQSFNMIFNGATWDRLKGITGQTGLLPVGVVNSGTTLADGMSSGQFAAYLDNGGSARQFGAMPMLFNNSTVDRARSGASANLPNLIGSTLVAPVAIDPCQSPSIAKSSAAINISTATTTQLVAPSGSTVVYVCGFDFTISEVVTTANTLSFNTGTGATCGGSTVTKTGLYGAGGVTAGDPIHVQSSGSGTIFSSAAASGVCAVTAIGGSGTFQGIITFVQM